MMKKLFVMGLALALTGGFTARAQQRVVGLFSVPVPLKGTNTANALMARTTYYGVATATAGSEFISVTVTNPVPVPPPGLYQGQVMTVSSNALHGLLSSLPIIVTGPSNFVYRASTQPSAASDAVAITVSAVWTVKAPVSSAFAFYPRFNTTNAALSNVVFMVSGSPDGVNYYSLTGCNFTNALNGSNWVSTFCLVPKDTCQAVNWLQLQMYNYATNSVFFYSNSIPWSYAQ